LNRTLFLRRAVRKRREPMLEFLKSSIRNPLQVGAIAPSSPYLGRAMAKFVLQAPEMPVIEVGPGTGAITEELLMAGIAPERLTLIEREMYFEDILRAKFPNVQIIFDDAVAALSELPAGPSRIIVSSLPLLSFSRETRTAFGAVAAKVIGTSGRLIQFTYGQFNPLRDEAELIGKRVEFVLRNAPPAWVWSYRANMLRPIKS
jgi:phosphatidylethanolamine/phosphatidyl-N-methylethanolamine N-methyltransferase